MRSLLTMLGIVVGVAAVITMVAVGSGASARVKAQIESLGSNLLVVQPGASRDKGARGGWGGAVTLTSDDAAAIAAEVPTVAATATQVRGNAQIVVGNRNWYSRVEGVSPSYLPIRNFEIQSGGSFTEQDDQAAARVAVIGQTVVEQIFAGLDPLGQTMRLNGTPFVVVGTLRAKGQSPTGEDQDDTILVPIRTAKRKLLGRNWANAQSVRAIYVEAKSPEQTLAAEQQITDLLRYRHGITGDKEDDFQVRNLTSRFEAQEESSQVMTLMLASIASVSLLVGGIGIMNIMLVSVSERTKEIGLRQAVGAKTRDIVSQFLAESVTLSCLGGILGIALGIGFSIAMSRLAGWDTLITVPVVLVAFGFSSLVGVFFGYYPARKAAMLDPIEALRYE